MALPTIRRNDNPARELDFDQPVVNIGAHPENDVKLAGMGILPFHAMVIRQGDAYQLVPLSTNASVYVEGQPVNAAGIGLTENQPVQIGDYTLAFRRNGTPTSMHVLMAQTGGASSADSQTPGGGADTDSAIVVNALTPLADIQVDQTANYQIEVINAGPIVASFSVRLQGVPVEWVDITPRTFNLNEEQKITVTIKVSPPRSPDSAAGKHALNILVTSPNYARAQVSVPVDLIIQPYYQFTLGNLSPRQQNISYHKKVGTARLPITNQGNGDANFNITAQDEENGCTFDFHISDDLQLNKQATFNIPAGTTVNLPIEITPLKRSVFAFSSKRYQYTSTVQVAEQAVSPQMVSGSVNSFPLFGWWSIMIGIIALLLGVFILLQPRISDFFVVAGKDVIELGDTTQLQWSVSPFATRLNISGIDQAITYGQNTLTIAPKQSTTYELVAGNWLSGLMNLDQKKSQTVLVVPPTPNINVFDVDSTSVARGKAVNLRWSVTQADSALLTIGGVVTTLTPDKFSGTQAVILNKDTLVTLEAVNASGSELRSYYINVVEPKITISKFTIWVRPQASAEVLPAPAPLAALPDFQPVAYRPPHLSSANAGPNPGLPAGPLTADEFIQKYVELVADNTSDTGYRVSFLQPKRELAKGEQVMVEWSVDGTDSNTVQIAPFTDILPNKGRQPFFPQASMNFVMTATSGDQKKLFMLPVVVFDGQPPVAPSIDIYQASPMSMVGAGPVQFAWSVSGAWTHIQLANGKGIVADYLNPQGFKKVNVTKNETFILTAWNGTLSASKAIDITVNPALIDPGLVVVSIAPTTGRSQVGGALSVTIGFNSIPSGSAPPTGSVTVTDGSAICSIPLPANTCSLIFTTSGIKKISASFPGDKIYQQAQSSAFTQTVDVASSQVNLNPVFYFNGGTTPISVESALFDLDKGLHAIVEVRPINTVLADNNGNISVSLCDQDLTGAYVPGTCSYVSAAQVKIASTTANGQTAGYGYADFVIPNFSATGVHGFLFEYTHTSNSIDPTSIFQPNIHVNRAKLSLSLASCTDPYNFITCIYGISPNVLSEVIFDMNIPGTNGPVPLSSLLPAPKVGAFTLSSSPLVNWACVVKVISGSYKLDCPVTGTGLVADTTYTLTFGYNNADPLPGTGGRNDYFMGSDPSVTFSPISFQLKALNGSKVLIGPLNGITVGERIHLTGPAGGLVNIYNGANTQIFPTTSLTLEETSGKDIFGVENEGAACSRDNGNGSRVIVLAANSDCYIYFKHTGAYNIRAIFAGDSSTNSSTSSDTLVNVLKQTKITANIQYLDSNSGAYNPVFPTLWTTNKSLAVRAELNGPLSNFSPTDTSFPPTALVGRSMLVTLNAWGTTNCTVNTDAGSLVTSAGTGIYAVQITQKKVGTGTDPTLLTNVTAADFEITCTATDNLGLSFTLAFSDQTTPIKDSDDFAFSTSPVGIFNVAIGLPNLGSMTVSVTRQDSTNTEMVAGTSINKLHFGQKYTVGISSSSNISVPYQYSVDYTYTYYYPSGGGFSSSVTTNVDPTAQSNSTRTVVLNNYSSSAKWSVDPTNFLSQDPNLGTTGSTCGLNMAMHATDLTGTPSEYSTWAWLSGYGYYSGTTYVVTYQYRRFFYGTMTFQLNTTNAQKCTLVFDSAGTTNNPINTTGGIAINALSGDGLFVVNSSFPVSGIDKQTATMSFSPTGTLAGTLNTDLPITVSFASSDITGGTVLPYFLSNQSFTSNSPFSALIDGTCPNLSLDTANSTVTPSIIAQFLSTSAYSSCQNSLIYFGDKYFKPIPTPGQDLPLMGFAKASATLGLTAALPFGSSAFTNVSYTGLVAHAANPAASSPKPTGTVKVEMFDNSNNPYTCSDFTVTSTPALPACASGAYTLTVNNGTGDTPAFAVSFDTSTVSSGNTLKLTYSGDGNFLGKTYTTSAFAVTKHVSAVAFSAALPFSSIGYNTASANLTIVVSDADSPTHSSPLPGGTASVLLQVLNSSNTPRLCSDYTLSVGSCSIPDSGYKFDVTAGSTVPFTITFNPSAVSTGDKIKLSYAGDGNFQADTFSSAAFSVTAHSTVLTFTPTPLAFSSQIVNIATSNISVQVADSGGATNPIPSGSVKIELINSSSSLYTCADYTLTISPAVSCSAGAYTLPLDGTGSTANFTLTFNASTISTGNKIKATYLGDSYFQGTSSLSSGFAVTKHSSSVAFSAALPFTSIGVATTSANLTIVVSDADTPTHSNPIPSGSVTLQVLNSSNTPRPCTDYNLSVGACSGGNTYTLPLTSGSTAPFTIAFNSSAVSTGNKFKLNYGGDANFLNSGINSAAFDVTLRSSALTFTPTPLAFSSRIFNLATSNISIKVADAGGAVSPVPGSSVKVELINSASSPYACADYTITISPAVTCSSGAYSLPLDGTGSTANFTVTFNSSMISTGNKIKATYLGDSNFEGTSSSSSSFAVIKHNSAVAFSAAFPDPIKIATPTVSLTAQVTDAEVLSSHLPVPSGTVTFQLLNSANSPLSCPSDYTLTAGTCNSTSYDLTLSGGNTSAFTITIKNGVAVSPPLYSYKLTYNGDSNFFTNSTGSTFTLNP